MRHASKPTTALLRVASNSTGRRLLKIPTTMVQSQRPLTPAGFFVSGMDGCLQRSPYCSSSITLLSNNNDDTGSHNDFAPKRKVISNDEEAFKLIDEQVKNNPVMLYMKGNPSMPMCGFSAKVVQILKTEGVDFSSVNVLDYPIIRDGIKKYADWPTIPQLYVSGEFIGGCDIVTSMHQSGELAELLKTVPTEA